MTVTYKMPDLVDTLNNPHLTIKDVSAIRWAIVTIQTLRHDLCECEKAARPPCSELTSEARA